MLAFGLFLVALAIVIRPSDRGVATLLFIPGATLVVYSLYAPSDSRAANAHANRLREPEDPRDLSILRRTPVYL